MDKQISFQEITKSEVNQNILTLDTSKAFQESDIPTEIIKANSDDIFKEVIHKELNPFSTNVLLMYKPGSWF